MGEHNPAELEYAGPNGCKILSAPSQYKVTEAGELICDGFTHRVLSREGKEIGQAQTLGIARLIARNGGPLPEQTPNTGGSKKGHKK